MKRFALLGCTLLVLICSAFLSLNRPSPSHAQGADTPTPTLALVTAAPPPTLAPSPNPCDYPPATPRLASPARDVFLHQTTIVLKWTKVGCGANYRLQVHHDSKTGRVLIDNTFKRKAFIATLEMGHRYVWRVTACTDMGCRSTAWRKFTILPSQPLPTWTPAPQQPTPPPHPTVAPQPTTNPYRYGFVRHTCEYDAGTAVHIIVFSDYKDPSSYLAGARVIASYAPDSPGFGDVIGITNQNGEFVYTMSIPGDPPFIGNVYAWVVDSKNIRISPVAGPVKLNGKHPDEPDTCWIAKFYFAGGAP